MKKCLMLVIMACMLVLSACSNQVGNYDKSVSKDDTISFSLNGNSNTYRLQKFIDNIDKGKIDRINLVRYTTEGDPIITQLYFNGEHIEIAIDNSKDKFGGQDKNKIIHKTINGGNKLKEDLMKYLKDNGFFYL